MTRQGVGSKADVLYVSYDGLLEPIGRSQVLSYLLPLAEQGIRFEVLSFEKESDLQDPAQWKTLESLLERHAIGWTRLRYHHRPKVLSTVFDIIQGTRVSLRIARAAAVRLVHARSYVPALMSLPLKWLTGSSFLFDMRGFWPEERVELGIFGPRSILYHLAKYFERLFLRNADQLVVLTQRAKKILSESLWWKDRPNQIEVIPCCVDISRFPPRAPSAELAARYGLSDKLVIGNLGSINRRYLLNEMFRFYSRLKHLVPHLRFVYLTRQPPDSLIRVATAEGLKREDFIVVSASPEEVPEWLSLFQLGVFFLKSSYAAQASSFTKLGEFLAAGVPVVTGTGVGDVEEILSGGRAGILLREFSEKELSSAALRAAAMLPLRREHRNLCRQVAVERFALEKGSTQYLSVYKALLSPAGSAAIARELSRKVS